MASQSSGQALLESTKVHVASTLSDTGERRLDVRDQDGTVREIPLAVAYAIAAHLGSNPTARPAVAIAEDPRQPTLIDFANLPSEASAAW